MGMNIICFIKTFDVERVMAEKVIAKSLIHLASLFGQCMTHDQALFR